MKRSELIRMYACQANIPDARAADELDRAIAHIVQHLKEGEAVKLPGLGILRSDPKLGIEFWPTARRDRE